MINIDFYLFYLKIDGIIYIIDIKSRRSCNEFLKIRNIHLTRTCKTNLGIQYNEAWLSEHLQSPQVTIYKNVCPELNFPLEVIRVYWEVDCGIRIRKTATFDLILIYIGTLRNWLLNWLSWNISLALVWHTEVVIFPLLPFIMETRRYIFICTIKLSEISFMVIHAFVMFIITIRLSCSYSIALCI